MPVIGITGGIASGKSTVTRLLAEKLRLVEPCVVFSADECAHELLNADSKVHQEVVCEFGSKVLNASGGIERSTLRQLVFEDPSQRQALEAILHPRIREVWTESSKEYRAGHKYFVAEIPLLYETNCASYFDCIIVVDAEAQVQLARLSSKRGWSMETARRAIDAQMSLGEKTRKADILILNDHTETLLHRQIELTARALLIRYA